MLEPASYNASITLPPFIWETVLNSVCVNLYTDDSTFAETTIQYVTTRVPAYVSTETTNTKTPCTTIMVFATLTFFLPPEVNSCVTILLTETKNADDESALMSYAHNNFFWISDIQAIPTIWIFDEYNALKRVSNEETLKLLTNRIHDSLLLPNFNGKEFHIAISNNSVYSQVDSSEHISWVGGVDYDVILFCCELLNLTVVIHSMPEIGELRNDGTATGVLSLVLEQKVDVGVGGIWLGEHLSRKVDFVSPWDARCGHYLVPRPKIVVRSSNVLSLPFEDNLWVGVLASVIIGSIMKTTFARYTRDKSAERYVSLTWSIYATMMHLILRYYPNDSENRGVMRPLFVSWSWLSFVLVSAYTSQLAAIFVSPHYEEKSKTIAEFYQRGYYWGDKKLPNLYQVDRVPVSKLWRANRFIKEVSREHRNLLMSLGNYIIPGESVGRYFYFFEHVPDRNLIQNYEVAGHCYTTFYSTPIFPLGSPYTKPMNRIIANMRMSGLKKYRKYMLFSSELLDRFIPPHVFTLTANNKTKEIITVDFSQVSFPFTLLITGEILAVILFIAELINKKFSDDNETSMESSKIFYPDSKYPYNN